MTRFDARAARVGLAVLAVAGIGAAWATRAMCLPDGAATAPDAAAAIGWLKQGAMLGLAFLALWMAASPLRRATLSRYGVFLLPLAVAAMFEWLKLSAGNENSVYICLAEEDSVVEYSTALLFFLASPIAGFAAHRAFKAKVWPAGLFLLGICALTLFMGLEEISYGQRIFGFATPADIARENYQQEFNLHNLSSLTWLSEDLAPNLIVQWGLVGWIGAWLLDRLFQWALPWRLSLRLAAPPWFLAPYFIPYWLYDFAYDHHWIWPTLIDQDQEVCELSLAAGFLAFSVYCLRYCVTTDLTVAPARAALVRRAEMSA